MTLKEAFDLLMPGHRPKMEMSESGIWWCLVGFAICPEALAEAAICWAMVKALARSESGCELSVEEGVWHALAVAGGVWAYGKSPEPDALAALAAAYASAFPKENK